MLFRVVPNGYPAEFIDTLNQNVADELFARGEANIGVTKVGNNQSLKMTTLSPIATLDNVKALLAQVLAEAERIKQSIVDGSYTPPIDTLWSFASERSCSTLDDILLMPTILSLRKFFE